MMMTNEPLSTIGARGGRGLWLLLILLRLTRPTSAGGCDGLCSFAVNGRCFDLSPFRGVTLSGPGVLGHSKYDVSVCGNLTTACEDALTRVNITGYLYSYFGDGPGRWQCWDALAKWDAAGGVGPVARPLRQGQGLVLVRNRTGDAHLPCASILTTVRVVCDPAAEKSPRRAIVQAAQVSGQCEWHVNVTTANPAVCRPVALAP